MIIRKSGIPKGFLDHKHIFIKISPILTVPVYVHQVHLVHLVHALIISSDRMCWFLLGSSVCVGMCKQIVYGMEGYVKKKTRTLSDRVKPFLF